MLSIIIPAKNEARQIPRLLSSIQIQSSGDYEVIVADAQSTDATREVVVRYGGRVVEGGMPGPGRNAGAKSAIGDWLLFLDADSELPAATCLNDWMGECEKRQIQIASAAVKPISTRLDDRMLHELYNLVARRMESRKPFGTGACILVRREVFDQLGGFDERIVFAEDQDLLHRAHAAGYRFGLLRSHPILTSVRRLEKDGRLTTMLRFFKTGVQMLRGERFQKPPFDYKMGGDE